MRMLFLNICLIFSTNTFAKKILNCTEKASLRFDYDNIDFSGTKMPLNILYHSNIVSIIENKNEIIITGAHENEKQKFKKVNENIYLLNNKMRNKKTGQFIGYSSILRISQDKKTVIKTKLDELSNLFVSSEIFKCK